MLFKYPNEAAFSKALVKHLRAKGYFVQRIESGETGKGIPDIYCISPTGVAVWLELKRIHQSIGAMPTPVRIPWRVGQQAWLHEIVKRKQLAYTIACFDDLILQIPHDKVYPRDTVHPFQCEVFTKLSSL